MSFDVRSEKIDLIKGPELPDYNMFMSQKFTSYEGKLAILLTGNGDCSFYMWILEDAAKHEWSKKAYVVPDFFPLDPFVLLMQRANENDIVRTFHYDDRVGTSDAIVESTPASPPRHIMFSVIIRKDSPLRNLRGAKSIFKVSFTIILKTFIVKLIMMKDFQLDGDMIISKTLSRTDVDHHGRLFLPKNQVLSVLKKMRNVTKESLRKGIELEVVDIIENDSYSVILKSRNTTNDFVLASGWSIMKHSLDLQEGDDIKLYWDYLNYKFIILNFEYTLIP
ncbi:putative B3 domain-containing protein [Arabidopsis thaliana]